MNSNDWLIAATATLTKSGDKTARLDALILLEDCLGQDRASLLAHPEIVLTSEQLRTLDEQINRRAKHEPLAYIRARSEFYGRSFYVNSTVLEPRPESETIIELLKKYAPQSSRIVDIGTGSGALAITAKLELPSSTVAAVDIDEACVAVAQHNAKANNAQISFYTGNLLEPFLGQLATFSLDVIMANLPYVPDDYAINEAAQHEPALALFGGADGLDLYRVMAKQIAELSSKPALIITESLPQQHPALAALMQPLAYKLAATDDFIQAFVL